MEFTQFGSVRVQNMPVRAGAKADGNAKKATKNSESDDSGGEGEGEGEGETFCGDCAPPVEVPVPPAEKVLTPADVIDLSTVTNEIYIIGTRQGKVTTISGLDHLTETLQILVLRSCLVPKMDGVLSLINLTKLELYDNCVEEIAVLSQLKSLRILDLSFNAIRCMAPVAECPLLEELYVAQNKLRKMEGLQGLSNLKVLDLGANRIRVIEGLEGCTALRSLWLGKNKIEEVQGLDALLQLRQLDIQSNRLSQLGDGLRSLRHLEELYLASNALECVVGLPAFTDAVEGAEGAEGAGKNGGEAAPVPSAGFNRVLHTLDLSNNRLSCIAGVEQMAALEELWMTKALLESYESLQPLAALPKLTCVYLEHSPIAKDFEYRKTVSALVPSLTQLDATEVSRRG